MIYLKFTTSLFYDLSEVIMRRFNRHTFYFTRKIINPKNSLKIHKKRRTTYNVIKEKASHQGFPVNVSPMV